MLTVGSVNIMGWPQWKIPSWIILHNHILQDYLEVVQTPITPNHARITPDSFSPKCFTRNICSILDFSLCFFFCLWFSNPKLAKTARIWKSARKLFFLPENPFRLEFWLRLKLQPAWDPRYTYVCIFIRVYQYTHIYVSTCVYILFHDMYLYIIIYIYIFTVYYIIIIYTYICTHQLTTTVSASSTTWSQVLELKEDWAKVHSRCVCVPDRWLSWCNVYIFPYTPLHTHMLHGYVLTLG